MVRLLNTAVAFPDEEVTQAAVAAAMSRWMSSRDVDTEKVLRIFRRSGVERRRIVVPLEHLFDQGGFGDRNRAYTEHGLALAGSVSRQVLEGAAVESTEIDLVTTASCTGFAIPSLDAYLANSLPFHGNIRRLPITELGCAGGAMALSHSADILDARRGSLALVVAVELSSVNVQEDDSSMAYLVSCALFGDGAAGVLLAGEESGLVRRHPEAPRIVRSLTAFFPDTLQAMGFRVESSGFHMVLDAAIPDLLAAHLPGALDDLLRPLGLRFGDVDHFLMHPGGRRILDTAESVLDLPPEALGDSRAVLAEHGNLSSASILALWHRFQSSGAARPGDRAVLVAFGPGFNAELILVEWPRC